MAQQRSRAAKIKGASPDTGVSIYSREALEHIEYEPRSAELIKPAIEAFNNRNPDPHVQRRHLQIPELALPLHTDAHESILLMGKAVVTRYSGDFAIVDTSVSSASEEATNAANRKLKHYCDPRWVGFAFLFEKRAAGMPVFENPLIETLRTSLAGFNIPSMTVVEFIPVQRGEHGEAPPEFPKEEGQGQPS